MDATVELLTIGRDRVNKGWNKGSLVERWQEPETFGFVTTVCALGGLLPGDVFENHVGDGASVHSEEWIAAAYEDPNHCKAVACLVRAIRETDEGEALYHDRVESQKRLYLGAAGKKLRERMTEEQMQVSVMHDVIASWNDDNRRQSWEVEAVYSQAIGIAEVAAMVARPHVTEADLVVAGD